jgi:hypothetical protein
MQIGDNGGEPKHLLTTCRAESRKAGEGGSTASVTNWLREREKI